MELLEVILDEPSMFTIVIAWPATFIYFLARITRAAEIREERLIEVNERWANLNQEWAVTVKELTRMIQECERRNRK